jgi:hypothetical protein
MSRVIQEFYCHGCDGYFLVNLNTELNYKAKINCPNCGRRHDRIIKNGLIYDKDSQNCGGDQEIITQKSTYSKTPRTSQMQKLNKYDRRDGVSMERWLEVAAREQGLD